MPRDQQDVIRRNIRALLKERGSAFIFSTTRPADIDRALRSRCTEIELTRYSAGEVARMAQKRFSWLTDDHARRIALASRLTPRVAFDLATDMREELWVSEDPSANICGAGVGAHLLRGKGDFFKVGGERAIRLQCAIPGKYVSGATNAMPGQNERAGQGAAASFTFPTLPASKPAETAPPSTLREMWSKSSEDDRRLIVGEHILANAIKADVALGDARGQLSKSMFVRLVAGRPLAGNLVESGLPKLYDAATATPTATATSTEVTPPLPA